MVVVETTRVCSLPVILISLGSKTETPFYRISDTRVNTILTHFRDCPRHAGSDVVRRLHSATRQRARAVCEVGQDRSLITCRRSRKSLL